jgi:hypothetical protein
MSPDAGLHHTFRQQSPDGLVGDLIQALREGATPATPCFLSHRQRWRWLMDTLQGHPLIRGHQRPRDFPIDPAARRILATAIALQQLPLKAWPDGKQAEGHPNLGSWAYAFGAVVEGLLAREREGHEKICRSAVQWVIWTVLRAAGKASSAAACQRLAGTLGMTLNEMPLLLKRDASVPKEAELYQIGLPGEDSLVAAAATAALLASIAATQEDPGRIAGLHAEHSQVTELLNLRFWLVSLKPSKVQAFLSRARLSFLQRGASAWASQALALAREGLVSIRAPRTRTWVLVTDVDALAEFITFTKPQARRLSTALQRHFEGMWSKGDVLEARMPRLAQVARRIGDSPEDLQARLYTLPPFEVQASPALNLRQLCVGRPGLSKQGLKAKNDEGRGKGRIADWHPAPPVFDGPSCPWVAGDRGRLPAQDLLWLDGDRTKPTLGWSAMTWSLAGMTHRLMVHQGLCEGLARPDLSLITKHPDWLEALRESDGDHAYLKLDGDGVGVTLGTLPKLQASTVGLDILLHLQAGLLEGLNRVIGAWQANHPGQPLTTLPLDLLYLGGDDLVCSLPAAYLDDFLAGFEGAALSRGVRSFTGAALVVPASFKAGGQLAPSLLHGLLEYAKTHTHGEATPQGLQDLCREIHGQGAGIRLAPPPKEGGGLSVWAFVLEPASAEVPGLEATARGFAVEAHASCGQVRRYFGDPYAAHLEGVVRRVRQVATCTEEMLAAAWLHDVLEDVPAVTPESLDTLFGPQVASLVQELTEVRRAGDGNRAARTAEQRARLTRVSAEAQTLKLADLLDNAEGILAHDRAFTPLFLQEVGGLLEVLDKGDPLLHQRLTEVWASGTP